MPGDQTRARTLAAVELVGGERRELEERGSRIEQALDPIAHEQLSARAVPRHLIGAAALLDLGETLA